MPATMRLYEDILPGEGALALRPLPRMIFVVHGEATIAGRVLTDGETWHGEDAVTLTPANVGVNESVRPPLLWLPVAKQCARLAASSKLPPSTAPEAIRILPLNDVSPKPSAAEPLCLA